MPGCESVFLDLYYAFASAGKHPARQRMYALVIQGGGRISELQKGCSMPLDQALARFELHWDDRKEETWCRHFTDRISDTIRSKEDSEPGRPYRGYIWLEEQASDENLDQIFLDYDRRFL